MGLVRGLSKFEGIVVMRMGDNENKVETFALWIGYKHANLLFAQPKLCMY
jgi:hypothetical protein